MATQPMIEEIRKWIKGCPIIDEEDRINVNYLGVEPSTYTIEDVPTTPVLKQYLGSALKQKNFVIASRVSYGIDELTNIANSGLYDNLSAWVEGQNKARSYPDFGENKQIMNTKTTSTGYIIEADAGTARYQIPLQITYYEKEV